MIIDAEAHIAEVLDQPEINEELNNKVFWELAPEDTEIPFLVYHIESDGKVTKDGINSYNVWVRIFARSMTKAAQISKVVHNAIDENKNCRWRNRGEKSGYVDTDAKEGYVELNYNFKIK